MNVGNGEEESIEVVVHLLRDTHKETVKQGKNWTIRGYGVIYKLKVLKWSGRGWIWVPKCFLQQSIPSRKSGIFSVI